MYQLQTVDLGQAAGGQTPPFAIGIPVCSVMVIAAPTGFTASIADAQTKQYVPLPPAGQGFAFLDPVVGGLVVSAPAGQAGLLLLALNLTPAGFAAQAGGQAFKGSASIADLGVNTAGIIQLLNPTGSGVVATVTKVGMERSSLSGTGGLYLAADIGTQAGFVPNGFTTGGIIQPMSGAAIAAGIQSKLVYRFRQDGATPANSQGGIPGTAVHNLTTSQVAAPVLDPAGQSWTLTPGIGLVFRSTGNDAFVWILNTEHREQ